MESPKHETWLSEEGDEKLWETNKRYKFFRYDRKSNEKKKGGGVILAVPKSLNPKKRSDLNHMSKKIFLKFMNRMQID